MIYSFKTLYMPSSSEFIEKKSKFISNAFPINTELEAQKYIKEIKKKFFNASHNVFSYRLLNNIEKQSDDGEPNSSAGPPILNILKKENIQNILIVVTRYYGGINLGIGGLIRLYGTAAKLAIENATIITKYLMQNIIITCNYSYAKKINNIISKEGHILKNIIYEDDVKLIVFIKYNYVDNFINTIINITNNNVKIKKYEKIYGFFINNKFYK